MTDQRAGPEVTPLTFVATSDLAAITKGRSMPSSAYGEGATTGWVPANLGIGPDGLIAERIPFDATGDLRLLPDRGAEHHLTGVPGKPDTTFVFADLVTPDGAPWPSCPRTFLRRTAATLQEEFGLTVQAAFEHEFVDLDPAHEHHPFTWRAFRAAEPIGSQLVTAMEASGLEPENWLPEYGRHQYEITVGRTDALAAADRAILVRDLVHDVFAAAGRRVSFTPVVTPGGGGNGVHVHVGLQDARGGNALFDPDRPGRLSELGGRFAAGIVGHARSLSALLAPLAVSYLRLRPHQWSAAGAYLGLHDREALLRVCPTVEIDGRDPEPQLHLEFRAADAGANPWLVLGALLRAGLEGLRAAEPAELVVGKVDAGPDADVPVLPSSLEEALDLFEADETVRGWFDPDLVDTFLGIKRAELAQVGPMSEAEQCAWYARVY